MRLTIAIAAAAVAAVLRMASLADAAPGDYRLVTGVVVWPLEVSLERTIVIQGDDGVMHFAELAPAESFQRARAGERVTVLGREGFQPTQLLFAHLERREDASGAPAALPLAVVSPPAVADIRDSPDVVVGVVEELGDRSLTLTTRSGARIVVDVSTIDQDLRRDLRPGELVTVYAPTRVGGLPVASGIVIDHTPQPAAFPRQ